MGAGRVVIKTRVSFRLVSQLGGWLVVEHERMREKSSRFSGGGAKNERFPFWKSWNALNKRYLGTRAATSAEAPLRGSRCPICPSASTGTRRVVTAAFNLQLCKVSRGAGPALAVADWQ